jgi:hypothetical protein
LSGLFELFSTFGSAYFRNNQDPGKSELYNSIQLVFNTPDISCADQTRNVGIMTSLVLNYEAPTAVYYDLLSTNLG